MIVTVDWYKCHGQSWSGIITPESFAHPAKFSRALIRRIYEHAIEQEYIAPGARVVDPFGGVALGALHAMQNGLHWVGCELEEKFVGLGRANIELWNRRYSELLPRWGTATLLQGDSRELAAVLGGAGCVVSSPPYADQVKRDRPSEPYEQQTRRLKYHITPGTNNTQSSYADNSSGQLGAMPTGDVNAVISSPPYSGARIAQNGGGNEDNMRRSTDTGRYGATDGQLGAMVLGSPPYEQSLSRDTVDKADRVALARKLGISNCQHISAIDLERVGKRKQEYGATDGQLGQETGDTFWQAARTIMEQCYQILTPGAVAIWVLKAFVRNKVIVDFPGQWQQLGEACGFETVEVIRAWLVEDRGAQYDLFGGLDERKVERKSFFRRLYEKKYPGNSIDFEVVLVQRKPK